MTNKYVYLSNLSRLFIYCGCFLSLVFFVLKWNVLSNQEKVFLVILKQKCFVYHLSFHFTKKL